jgi:hypothetical protein
LVSLVLAALVAQSTDAGARAEVEIVCSGQLPFSQAEMASALRARRPLLGAVSTVEVRAEEDGRTRVLVGAAQREVEWAGRTGEDAARLVAVLVLDLARAEAPMMVSSRPSPPPAASARALRAGLTLQSPFDGDGASAHLEPTLDVAVAVARGFAAFVAAGYRRVSAGTGAGALHLDELPLRAGLGYRRRWLELRLYGLARPYAVAGAGTYQDAMWGGGTSAAVRWPERSRLAVVLSGGLDVSRARMIFSVDQQPVLQTAWLAPWLGAGLTWETSL